MREADRDFLSSRIARFGHSWTLLVDGNLSVVGYSSVAGLKDAQVGEDRHRRIRLVLMQKPQADLGTLTEAIGGLLEKSRSLLSIHGLTHIRVEVVGDMAEGLLRSADFLAQVGLQLIPTPHSEMGSKPALHFSPATLRRPTSPPRSP